MCGLAGWVDFENDLSSHSPVAGRMASAMICRGPDDSGQWISERALLSHVRLSIIDFEGGRQPMQSDNSSSPVVTFTGEIYNYRELKAQLVALGSKFNTESDTEVVLRAFERWGNLFAERLNGMYAIAVWDPANEKLVLTRDRMGVKPLFYYPTASGILFGSEPKAILTHPDAVAEVDREGLAEIFSIVNTPGHAVFKGMHQVKPGTTVTIDSYQVQEEVYWRLTAEKHTDSLDETIATVRTLLEDIVERQLIADVPVGALLSGGLDSSAITALASRTLRQQDKPPIKAFTVGIYNAASSFTDNGIWRDSDTPFAEEVANYVGADHHIVKIKNDDLLNPALRARILRCQDLPISTGDMEHSLLYFCDEIKSHVTVALSGEAADELFGGYNWFFDEEAVDGPNFPWHDAWSRLGGLQALQTVGIWENLNLGDYVAKRYAEAMSEVPRHAEDGTEETRMRELLWMNISRWEKFLLDRKDRISMAAGLEVRVPFTDHRLVQYVYNIPWAMKTFDGREKSLLRAAVRNLLPESVLERRKSPYPSTQDLDYVTELRSKVVQLDVANGPLASIVDQSGLAALPQTPAESYAGFGGLWGTRAVLERLIEFDTWVKDYEVTIDLS